MDAAEFWSDRSARFARIASDQKSFYARRSALVARLICMHSCGRRMLDVGCGTGQLCMELARSGFDVHGTDLSAEQIASAVRYAANVMDHPHQRFRVGDATHIPFEGKFDLITAVGVLPYVERHREFVSCLAARLAPSGVLALSLTRPASLFTLVALCDHIKLFKFNRPWFWVLKNLVRTGVWSGGFVDHDKVDQCRSAAALDRLCRSFGFVCEDTLDLYNIEQWGFDCLPLERGRIARTAARWAAWSHIALYRADAHYA